MLTIFHFRHMVHIAVYHDLDPTARRRAHEVKWERRRVRRLYRGEGGTHGRSGLVNADNDQVEADANNDDHLRTCLSAPRVDRGACGGTYHV